MRRTGSHRSAPATFPTSLLSQPSCILLRIIFIPRMSLRRRPQEMVYCCLCVCMCVQVVVVRMEVHLMCCVLRRPRRGGNGEGRGYPCSLTSAYQETCLVLVLKKIIHLLCFYCSHRGGFILGKHSGVIGVPSHTRSFHGTPRDTYYLDSLWISAFAICQVFCIVLVACHGGVCVCVCMFS